MSRFIQLALLCPLLTLVAFRARSLAQDREADRAAGTFRVPLMQTAPKLDGRIDPAEWAASAGFDGFITMNQGTLQRRRARGFVGATATHLYVALQTQLPEEGVLLAETKADSLKAAYDDAEEVYVCPTPDAANRVDYQFLCNPLGKGGYNIHLLGTAKEEPSWQGHYRQAHTQQDGWWNTEIAIPLADLGGGKEPPGDGRRLGGEPLPRLEAGLGLEQSHGRLPALGGPIRLHVSTGPRRALSMGWRSHLSPGGSPPDRLQSLPPADRGQRLAGPCAQQHA